MAEDVSKETMEDINTSENIFSSMVTEIVSSPLNLFLLSICFILIYKIFKSSRTPQPVVIPSATVIKPLKKQDMTLQQLTKFDGTDEDGRICMAVNDKIFDVTKGTAFYGPGGPYAAFSGRDATRALATFNIADVKETYDDLSDLSSMQMDSVREWEIQINEKYVYIGKLLKPGEESAEYSEDDDKTPKKED